MDCGRRLNYAGIGRLADVGQAPRDDDRALAGVTAVGGLPRCAGVGDTHDLSPHVLGPGTASPPLHLSTKGLPEVLRSLRAKITEAGIGKKLLGLSCSRSQANLKVKSN